MQLSFNTDFSNFMNVFQSSKSLMQQIGSILQRNFIARTQYENVDSNLSKFKPYKPQYARSKGVSPDMVNLTSLVSTGQHMMTSVGIVNVSDNYVEVGVTGDNMKKALYNEDMGRSFLGVSKEDENQIEKVIERYLEDELRKL